MRQCRVVGTCVKLLGALAVPVAHLRRRNGDFDRLIEVSK